MGGPETVVGIATPLLMHVMDVSDPLTSTWTVLSPSVVSILIIGEERIFLTSSNWGSRQTAAFLAHEPAAVFSSFIILRLT